MYQRIRDLREDNDLTQQELAKILNVTQQQYSNLESGKSEFRADQLIILSKTYKVSIDYLVSNEK